MKRWGMLAIAGCVALAACGGDDSVDDALRSPVALYFHNQLVDYRTGGSTDAKEQTTVDLVARGDLANPFFTKRPYSTDEQDGIAFRLDADTESVPFDVYNNTTRLVSDKSFSVDAGRKYTMVLMGQVDGNDATAPLLRLYRQSVKGVSSDKVRIRLIHALSGLSGQPLRVAIGSTTLVDGLIYEQVTEYEEVAPVSDSLLELDVFRYAMWTGVDEVSCSVELGKSYDVIITHPAYDSQAVDIFCQQVHGS